MGTGGSVVGSVLVSDSGGKLAVSTKIKVKVSREIVRRMEREREKGKQPKMKKLYSTRRSFLGPQGVGR